MTPADLDALIERLKDDAVPSGGRWQVRQDAAAAITELRAEVARLKMNQRCSAIEQGEVGYPCVFRAEMERAEAEARTKIAEQLLRIAALEAERDQMWASIDRIVSVYDAYRGKGVLPAPNQYAMLVAAIDAAREKP